MKIITSVTVPDYVYLFYQKAAKELRFSRTEDLMADVLLQYAGSLSQKILNEHEILKHMDSMQM